MADASGFGSQPFWGEHLQSVLNVVTSPQQPRSRPAAGARAAQIRSGIGMPSGGANNAGAASPRQAQRKPSPGGPQEQPRAESGVGSSPGPQIHGGGPSASWQVSSEAEDGSSRASVPPLAAQAAAVAAGTTVALGGTAHHPPPSPEAGTPEEIPSRPGSPDSPTLLSKSLSAEGGEVQDGLREDSSLLPGGEGDWIGTSMEKLEISAEEQEEVQGGNEELSGEPQPRDSLRTESIASEGNAGWQERSDDAINGQSVESEEPVVAEA